MKPARRLSVISSNCKRCAVIRATSSRRQPGSPETVINAIPCYGTKVLVLGVDIGGTKIAAGLVDDRAQVVRCEVVPTRAAEGFEISFGQLCCIIDRLLTAETAAIGIC